MLGASTTATFAAVVLLGWYDPFIWGLGVSRLDRRWFRGRSRSCVQCFPLHMEGFKCFEEVVLGYRASKKMACYG